MLLTAILAGIVIAVFMAANRRLAGEIAVRKRVEASLEMASKEAKAANRAKSAFLASMSHELRTPLNAIIGYSELLAEEATDAGQQRDDLGRIQSAGRYLLSLINDILDLSKIESGRIELCPVEFDVAALLEEATTAVRPQIEAHDNRLEIDTMAGLGTMTSDRVRFKQCLVNLLGNAAKFTRDGTITLSARRRADERGAWFDFEVADTGIGIAPAAQDLVFEAFGQVAPSLSDGHEGTGLGLAITRRLCQRLGGEISLVSSPGEGSTFSIRLPADLPL